MWRPLGPTTSSTSASMSSCSTPSPTPTLSASRPSFAALASSPKASRTRSGNSSTRSWPGMTGATGTVLIAVGPPVLVGLGFAPITVPSGPDGAGGPPSSSSTSYGTTSVLPALDVAAGAAHGLDHRLARVRGGKRALEPATDLQTGHGQRLLQ